LNESINFRRAIGALNDAFEEDGPGEAATNIAVIRDAYRHGLPFVTSIIPATRVAIFARHGRPGTFARISAWPDERDDSADLESLSGLTEALQTNAVLIDTDHCFIPIGYCAEGELVMVIERKEARHKSDHRTREGAELIASSFLHATSRSNFVSGLQAETRTDPLTGLANRRSLYERIEIEMAHALRSESPLSLAMIDLDHFKRYNDTHGHVAGDTLLRAIAALMVSNIRGQDLAVRYGGEEFCLVLPDTDLLGAHHLLEGLRCGGREATTDFGVTLSAGLTSWDGIEDTTSFIERADQALYRAKAAGRNRVVSIQAVTDI
jgi:diguanylate cyclase (GGDEF)-like protein